MKGVAAARPLRGRDLVPLRHRFISKAQGNRGNTVVVTQAFVANQPWLHRSTGCRCVSNTQKNARSYAPHSFVTFQWSQPFSNFPQKSYLVAPQTERTMQELI